MVRQAQTSNAWALTSILEMVEQSPLLSEILIQLGEYTTLHNIPLTSATYREGTPRVNR